MTYRANIYEVYELMADILGVDLDDIPEDELEELLWDKYEIDGTAFHEMVNLLVPRIMIGQSPLTKEWYKGFTSLSEPSWLVKTEIDAPLFSEDEDA